ncbi:TonB-dependent receptor [Puia dinghuensis]|uniref:TonB-dependent receptor n=2 Tax=Puia dinghuensis TaxID=1792502 RepID=A0A8J2U796_9BACT|nr:TonB-dependent receptor [Puia dinghuensis]
MGGQIPSIGHFYGKVVDSKTGKGMDGASVQLIQSKYNPATHGQKDTVISGMITGRHGDFSLENLPILGNFRLRITAIGYTAYEQKVAFDLKGLRGAAGGGAPGGGNGDGQPNMAGLQALNAVDKDLGNIKLTEDAQNLEQVTVTASKPLIQMGVDRKIYNVEKDISAAGGSATDVMRNVPSVQVDIDGNVTLRNSPPTIFVDGRPTTLTLDQIPADAIQSVEIITNPGAKYDASGGTSGILNIVLKKNRKAGYNGNLRAGIDQRGKFNAGGDINVKQGKINFFLSGNYNQRKSIATADYNRYTHIAGANNAPDSLIEHDYNPNKGYFAFGRGGFDLLLDNRNTLTIAGNIVHGTFEPYNNSDLYTDVFPPGQPTIYSYTQRLSTTNAQFNNHGAMLSFKHTFPRSGEEWTADVNYSQGSNDNLNLITSNIYNVKGGPLSGVFEQQQVGNGNNKFFTAQTDYTLPMGEKSKLEAGARAQIRHNSSINDIDTLGNDNQFHVEGLLSSQYTFTDRVFAGYVTYGNAIKDFTYQLGLRGESSNYSGTEHYTALDSIGHQTGAIGNFSNQFPLSLFPSVFLTQKLGGNQDLSLNYTRRIDRPNFFQLFPFTDYSDSLNVSRGNPDLKPQFTNSFELAYQKTFPGNNTFLASTYYKYTTDLITRNPVFGTNPVSNKPVLISSFINARSSFVGGFELIGRNAITKWWDITSNINIFTSKINTIDTGLFAVQPVGETWSWYGKINNSFKLTKALTLQLSGDYTSKTVLPPGGSASNGGGGGGRGFGGQVSGNANGYSRPSGGADAALRYEFLKNRVASLTLSVSDIFRTRVNSVYTYASYYEQDAVRRRDPQFFRLQFNYRFGKFDVALFKRKNIKGEQNAIEGIQGGGSQQ